MQSKFVFQLIMKCYELRMRQKLKWKYFWSSVFTSKYVYSKASRYTASRCTDLAGARFWIRSKKIWDEQIYEVKTLNSTVLSCTIFFFPKKTCISRPYCKLIGRDQVRMQICVLVWKCRPFQIEWSFESTLFSRKVCIYGL